MKPKSEKSIELYHIMTERGYPEEFCDVITRNLNTDLRHRGCCGIYHTMNICRRVKL